MKTVKIIWTDHNPHHSDDEVVDGIRETISQYGVQVGNCMLGEVEGEAIVEIGETDRTYFSFETIQVIIEKERHG